MPLNFIAGAKTSLKIYLTACSQLLRRVVNALCCLFTLNWLSLLIYVNVFPYFIFITFVRPFALCLIVCYLTICLIACCFLDCLSGAVSLAACYLPGCAKATWLFVICFIVCCSSGCISFTWLLFAWLSVAYLDAYGLPGWYSPVGFKKAPSHPRLKHAIESQLSVEEWQC